MTKAELIERIARSKNLPPDMTKKDVATILGLAFEELAAYFARAKVTRTSAPRFTFPRFGTFTKKKRSARMGVNPRTLEPMKIDACHTVDFKVSKELRDAMNPGGAKVAGSGAKTPPPSNKTANKVTTKKTKSAASNGRAKTSKRGKGKSRNSAESVSITSRRLTPRDEEAELDALIDDDELFEEPVLPAARLQRVRSKRDADDKGSSARTG